MFSFAWTFGVFLCKFVHYMQNVSAICSVLTLTAMSIERWVTSLLLIFLFYFVLNSSKYFVTYFFFCLCCISLCWPRIDKWRYYAIVHPMRAQYLCTLSQARKVITATWITSFALATPTLWIQVIKYINIFSVVLSMRLYNRLDLHIFKSIR